MLDRWRTTKLRQSSCGNESALPYVRGRRAGSGRIDPFGIVGVTEEAQRPTKAMTALLQCEQPPTSGHGLQRPKEFTLNTTLATLVLALAASGAMIAFPAAADLPANPLAQAVSSKTADQVRTELTRAGP